MSILNDIWQRGESAWDELKQSRAQKSLRVQAEADILSLVEEHEKLKDDLDSKILKAKESKDWKSIRVANLDVELKSKELDTACKLYEKYFEESAEKFLK